MKVAYFGRPGSFAHQVAEKRFGSAGSYISCPTHPQVVDALLAQRASVGVLPIENSVAGVVMETIDTLVVPEFVHSRFKIREYLELAPELALLSHFPLKLVRRVYSHPYPIRYLTRWMNQHLPNVELFETVSTSEAALLASEQPRAAAIAGPHAAKIYGLKVIRRRLSKAHEYVTRFCVISIQPLIHRKTTHVAFCFGLKHRSGALAAALSILAKYKLNLTRILSRPLASRTGRFDPNAYLFWVDIEIPSHSTEFAQAIREFRKSTTFLDVIGEYFIRSIR